MNAHQHPSPCLAAALEYASFGWPVFPVPPGTKKSYAREATHGTKWGQTTDPDQIRGYWKTWPNANVGIVTGPASGIMGVDVDTPTPGGHSKDGIASLAALEVEHGPLPDTASWLSASGGRMYLFKYVEGIRNSESLIAPGIDVRGDGGMIVAPPSVKPGVGIYNWEQPMPLFPIADAPEWLVAMARKPPPEPRPRADGPPRDWSALGSYVDAAITGELRFVEQAPDGTRNATLNLAAFNIGTLVGAAACPEADAVDALFQSADRCGLVAEDGERAVMATIKSGLAAGIRNPREMPQEQPRRRFRLFEDAPNTSEAEAAPDDDWHSLLRLTKEGAVYQNHSNVLVALRHAAAWRGVFAFDEFAGKVVLMRPIPRHDGRVPNDFTPRPWTDADGAEAVEWFQLDDFPSMTVEKVETGVRQVAEKERAFHPVRDYLDGLRWDGVPRLETAPVRLWQAEASSDRQALFIAKAFTKWMISAVARIYRPGCKADHMLVLEGDQGVVKSQSLAVLAGEYFSDGLPQDLHSKDAADHLRGKWIVEMGELAGMRKSDVEVVKAYITRQVERFRPAYARHEVHYPRQCVFAGTTNRDTYLRDETGNRRFWPMKVGRPDLVGIRAERDQLWAEAVHRYRSGEEWWFTDPAMVEAARQEQADRFEVDVWQETIAAYLVDKDRVTIGEVLEFALKFDNSRMSTTDQRRVAAVLATLGWKRAKVVEGKRWWSKVSV